MTGIKMPCSLRLALPVCAHTCSPSLLSVPQIHFFFASAASFDFCVQRLTCDFG